MDCKKILPILACILLVSCGSNFEEADLIGTWEPVSSVQKIYTNGVLTNTEEFIQPTMKINSDKSGDFSNTDGFYSTFTWTLSKDQIIIVGSNMMSGEWIITELNDDLLTIKNTREEKRVSGNITTTTEWITVSKFSREN
jgi:hypothetical protein